MTNFHTTIVLKKTNDSILDPIFEVAEIEVELNLICKIHGGSPSTLYQPEEYPEAELIESKVKSINVCTVEESKNDSLVSFLLTDERKKEIATQVSAYIDDNWVDGENFENKVLEQAQEEYESYLDGQDNIEYDYDDYN